MFFDYGLDVLDKFNGFSFFISVNFFISYFKEGFFSKVVYCFFNFSFLRYSFRVLLAGNLLENLLLDILFFLAVFAKLEILLIFFCSNYFYTLLFLLFFSIVALVPSYFFTFLTYFSVLIFFFLGYGSSTFYSELNIFLIYSLNKSSILGFFYFFSFLVHYFLCLSILLFKINCSHFLHLNTESFTYDFKAKELYSFVVIFF